MLFGLFHRRRHVHVDIASISECGPVRRENQDHVLVNRRGLVFCVADGMGGGEGGALASEIVCREISDVLRRRTDFAERVRLVDDAVVRADERVRTIAEAAGYRQMGSTATIFVADPENGRSAAVGNIGDSRVYRLRGGELRQLTQDHTMEREILRHRGGKGHLVLPETRTSILSHLLTRAVGVGTNSRPDWRKVDMCCGDVFFLCSDGVHGTVAAADLKAALESDGPAKEIVAQVHDLVLKGGAPDNFSAIVVKIGGRT